MHFIDGRYDEETQTCKLYFLSWVGGEGVDLAPWIRYCVWSDLQQDNVTGNVGRWSVFGRRQLYRAVIDRQTAIVLP